MISIAHFFPNVDIPGARRHDFKALTEAAKRLDGTLGIEAAAALDTILTVIEDQGFYIQEIQGTINSGDPETIDIHRVVAGLGLDQIERETSVGTVSTETIERLDMPRDQLEDGKFVNSYQDKGAVLFLETGRGVRKIEAGASEITRQIAKKSARIFGGRDGLFWMHRATGDRQLAEDAAHIIGFLKTLLPDLSLPNALRPEKHGASR